MPHMDYESYRKYFPITDNYIYLDHAGVGPISTKVSACINEFLESATNQAGFAYDDWMEKVEWARKNCAALVGAGTDEIAFVKNTSHGISIVASGLEWSAGDNIVLYSKEFPSNIYPWLNLEKRGVEVRYLGADIKGQFSLEEIDKLADNRTRLIALSSVQYSNGFRADLQTIGEYCNKRNILFFVDAIQSLGVLPMDVVDCGIDFLSADGHKWLLAPEGTGIFYCSNEKAHLIDPIILGWKSVVDEGNYGTIDMDLKKNAHKFEEGSLNTLGIYALGTAVSLLIEAGIEDIKEKVHQLGEYVLENAEKREFDIVCPREKSNRGGIVSFKGSFDEERLRDMLQSEGVMVNYRGGAIRVSPHFYNSFGDIDLLFNAIDRLL